MENYINKITEYLPKIEEFLTSILLEETTVTVTENSMLNTQTNYGDLGPDDIYLHAYDELNNMDVIGVLDKEWFGLLSSIMLGVEEKTFNDTTKDLLKKFSGELKTTFHKILTEEGVEFKIKDVEVLPHKKLESLLNHTEYLYVKLEVEGLADENVHGAIMIGNPEAVKIEEVPEEEEVSENPQNNDFKETNGEEMEHGGNEETVSGRYIEFEDFDDNPIELVNEDGKNMDMLRDVEMEVSVELGRIDMPLGRVLQLAKGSVIELDKLAGEPVDILVNGQRIAQGEVVVIDEHFGVRISNLITTRQHLVKVN